MAESTNTFGNSLTALGIIGAVNSGINAYYSSKMNKIQMELQAKIAEENQRMSELAAQDALYRSQVKIGEISRKAQQVKSNQKVSMAAAGIAAAGGTYAEVLTSTDIMKEESINIETMNGYKAAWGYRMQGLNYGAQAGAARVSASSGNAFMQGFTGLVSGLTNVAYQYAYFNRKD